MEIVLTIPEEWSPDLALALVLDPDGRVAVSMSLQRRHRARLVPQDIIGLIRYLREHAPATQSR